VSARFLYYKVTFFSFMLDKSLFCGGGAERERES